MIDDGNEKDQEAFARSLEQQGFSIAIETLDAGSEKKFMLAAEKGGEQWLLIGDSKDFVFGELASQLMRSASESGEGT